jgi:hypothetical protein
MVLQGFRFKFNKNFFLGKIRNCINGYNFDGGKEDECVEKGLWLSAFQKF